MKQPLHQGAEKSGKTLSELSFAIVERKVVSMSPIADKVFHHCFVFCAYSEQVEMIVSVILWRNSPHL